MSTEQLASAFEKAFGVAPAVMTKAPGRVNLIGEHTDYNNGFVLPASIPQHTFVALRPNEGDTVRVWSREFACDPVWFDLGDATPRQHWTDYVRGIVALLERADHHIPGFDLAIASDVPVGSGLSSSAALQIAVMRALRLLFRLPLDDMQLALLAQKVEHEFAGSMVGVMDPMACAFNQPGYATFIDTDSLAHETVPLPRADLVVVHSGVSHQHAGGDYNTRRAECEAACAKIGVASLRQLGIADLPRVERLDEPYCRRARHVITENQRVLDAVAAMRRQDLHVLGELFNASHDSQRDDYAVSIKEIDLLVELARADHRTYGARLTGGGFGGSVVFLVEAGAGAAVAAQVTQQYTSQTGHKPKVLVPH